MRLNCISISPTDQGRTRLKYVSAPGEKEIQRAEAVLTILTLQPFDELKQHIAADATTRLIVDLSMAIEDRITKQIIGQEGPPPTVDERVAALEAEVEAKTAELNDTRRSLSSKISELQNELARRAPSPSALGTGVVALSKGRPT